MPSLMTADRDPPAPRLDTPAGAEDRLRERADEAGLSAAPGDGTLPRTEAIKDEVVRRWDVATPAATQIGRPERPEDDVSETVRRLHDEQHPAMAGHAERMHRLDKARITHALCSRLDVTPWQRDRALGVMTDLDLTAFGSRRAIPTVALVVIRHVVDEGRKRLLGLAEADAAGSLSPDRMAALYERFESLTDDERFRELMTAQDLDVTSVNRLTRILREQIEDEDLAGAALGRSPYRDAALPPVRG
jgi:hypothetical protein